MQSVSVADAHQHQAMIAQLPVGLQLPRPNAAASWYRMLAVECLGCSSAAVGIVITTGVSNHKVLKGLRAVCAAARHRQVLDTTERHPLVCAVHR